MAKTTLIYLYSFVFQNTHNETRIAYVSLLIDSVMYVENPVHHNSSMRAKNQNNVCFSLYSL